MIARPLPPLPPQPAGVPWPTRSWPTADPGEVGADTDRLTVDRDGWTLRSSTGCRTAHSEHTVAITRAGAEILTQPA